MNARIIPVNTANEPQSLAPAPDRAQFSDLLEYWMTISKHKWSILGLTLAIVVLTLLVVSSIKPTYRATATLLIEANKNKVVSIEEVYGGMNSDIEYIQTQVEILKSRDLAEKVVIKLKLATHPEFDSRQQTPPFWKRWLTSAGITGESFGFGEAEPKAAPSPATAAKGIVGAVQDRLEVQAVRRSQLIRVSFVATDPELAAKVANAFAETFIESDLDARYQMSQKASGWLAERLGSLRQTVEASERALQQYREKERIVDAKGLAQSGISGQLANLTSAQIAAAQRRSEAEIRYNQIRAAGGNYETLPAIASNATVLRMRDIETEAEKKLADLGNRYGKEHSRMLAAEAELKSARANTRDAINRAIETVTKEYEAARANEAAVERTLAQARDSMQSMNRKEYQLNVLEREVTSNRQLYDMFLGRFKETSATGGLQSTIARVVDPAITPGGPFAPNKTLAVQIAIVLSLILGALLAFVMEHLDVTIKHSGEVESKLGLPVLTTLPILTGKSTPALYFEENTHSIFSEAIRTARTGILLSAIDEPHKSIVITSSVPGEGKTTTSVNLALSFAHTKRVILVDADMRRPSIGKLFGKDSTAPGLSSFVAGTATAQECIFRVEKSELYVLPAGVIPPNPLELLLSKRFDDTLHKLMEMFDIVIIDAPPVMLVTDAMVIARRCTGLVYVVKADDVPYQVARNGIKRIRQSGVNIIGVALNQLDFERADRYHGEYTGYAKYGYRRYYSAYGAKKNGAESEKAA